MGTFWRLIMFTIGIAFMEAAAAAQTVAIFAGQSNEVSHGTLASTYGFAPIPGGVGAAGVNATALCYETKATLDGATLGSGTLTCAAPTTGRIYAGQTVKGVGVPPRQAVAAANNWGNFPAATGDGLSAGGSYVVTPAATLGSAVAPKLLTFAEPDIGGSGVLNPRCQIWSPRKNGNGSWQTYNPKVNSDFDGAAQSPSFGPEGAFCQRWTADNSGKTLFMIKIAIGGSSLCNLPSGNNYSPEFTGATGIGGFGLLQAQIAQAEAALQSQLGVTNYAVRIIQWGQGEQDSQARDRPCGFPVPPFDSSLTPNPYLANLIDLIDRLATPVDVRASFTGWISGVTLTVGSVSSGTMQPLQLVQGAGVAPSTYIRDQRSGAPGGAGVYDLQVIQAVLPETISSANGASCSRASLSGGFFYAYPLSYTSTAVVNSCMSGGAFVVGDQLSGDGVAPGTTITSLDSAGDTREGLYVVNVAQSVASAESPGEMTALLPGFGRGADTAQFLLFRTFESAWATPTGVQIAQAYVNDHPMAKLAVTTVNTDDALKATPTEIHYHASWVSELGRRLYQAYLGKCDYHAPTC